MSFLQNISRPSIALQLLFVALSAVLWFLPDMCGMPYAQPTYDFVVLNQFVWFSMTAFWSHFVQYFCILAWAVFVMVLCEKSYTLPARTAFPFVFSVSIISVTYHVQFFDASMVALLFFGMATVALFASYGRNYESIFEAYAMGFLVVAASIFQIEYIWLAVLFLVGLMIFGSLTIRTLFAYISGLLTPLIIMVCLCYLSDAMSVFHALNPLHAFSVEPYQHLLYSDLGFVAFITIVFLMSLAGIASSSYAFKLKVRLNFRFVALAFFGTAAWALCCGNLDSMLLVPLFFAMVMMTYLFVTRQNKFSGTLFIILVLACIAKRILMLFGI